MDKNNQNMEKGFSLPEEALEKVSGGTGEGDNTDFWTPSCPVCNSINVRYTIDAQAGTIHFVCNDCDYSWNAGQN